MSEKLSPVSPSALLTVKEVARHLGVSVRTVWRLVSIGKLTQPVSIGRCRRWHQREVDAFINALYSAQNN